MRPCRERIAANTLWLPVPSSQPDRQGRRSFRCVRLPARLPYQKLTIVNAFRDMLVFYFVSSECQVW